MGPIRGLPVTYAPRQYFLSPRCRRHQRQRRHGCHDRWIQRRGAGRRHGFVSKCRVRTLGVVRESWQGACGIGPRGASRYLATQARNVRPVCPPRHGRGRRHGLRLHSWHQLSLRWRFLAGASKHFHTSSSLQAGETTRQPGSATALGREIRTFHSFPNFTKGDERKFRVQDA